MVDSICLLYAVSLQSEELKFSGWQMTWNCWRLAFWVTLCVYTGGIINLVGKSYPVGNLYDALNIHSTYGIFTYIWFISMVNIGKYTIHCVSRMGNIRKLLSIMGFSNLGVHPTIIYNKRLCTLNLVANFPCSFNAIYPFWWHIIRTGEGNILCKLW